MTSTVKQDRPNKDQLVKRLNRIVGQVSGITRMIEEDRTSNEVLNQVAAARSALDALGMILLEQQAQDCIALGMKSGKSDDAVAQLLQVIKKVRG
ncbi:metal-sensitive transcriptional regulator [Chitinibacter bivalviorum]|uniref:Metal-sensitive transcriptional regulator n=1 Tax=Chitinibacter bivalviorum TaxID=2739434 RepID=A0A7H9BGL2_9NEIS|nr:metal-sensitive transcriptional regulator [Chitinibacter bivalviorum]QLG87863.1 metal-sensitive transcriptional regulator [Chitinibacter bivalviorum]